MSFITCTLHQILGLSIYEDNTDRIYSVHERGEKCVHSFTGKTSRLRDHLGDQDVDGRIALKWLLKKQGVRKETEFIWFRTGTSGGLFVNTVMNLRVPLKAGNFQEERDGRHI
jgi:hypothetical protein